MTTKSLYADSFWSPEDESVNLMNEHFHNSLKTMESVLSFYKERMSIEEDYARRLGALSKKTSVISKNESGTFKASLETLFRETKQLSSSHQTEASKIFEEIYKPLDEFINNQKGNTKSIESGMSKLLKYKQSMESKANVAKKKYETAWQRLNSCRTEQILMDDSEASRMQGRISKLTETMTQYRSEYYKAVTNYNELYKVFVEEWPKACSHYQNCDEAKVKFLKENIWEYANSVSSSCLLDDQSSENIRLSLEKCSVTKDLRDFVDRNQTGTNIYSPLEFIDFVKGHSDVPRTLQDVRILKETYLKKGTEKSHVPAKKNPPPELTKTQETQFDFLDRREQTFKELQRQHDLEEDKADNYSNPSESSGSKIMSDISQVTTNTAYSKDKMEEHGISLKDRGHHFDHDNIFSQSAQSEHPTLYSNPLLESLRSTATDKPTKPLSIEHDTEVDTRTKRSAKSSNLTLKEYFAQVNIGGDNDKFRDSMQQVNPIEALKSTDDMKKNSFGNLLKKKIMSFDSSKESSKTSNRDILSMVPLPQEQLKKRERSRMTKRDLLDTNSTTSGLSSARVGSVGSARSVSGHQLHKSKSVTTLKSKFLSGNNLPLESSEGYKVLKYTKAQYSYTADIDQELSFKKRDVLLVLHMQPDGWWFAENLNSGASGLAPSNYLVEI